MNENNEKQTLKIKEASEWYLKERLEELDKRAKKLKLGMDIGYDVVRRYVRTEKRWDLDGEEYTLKVPMVEFTLRGSAPVLQGWSLVGRLDFVAIPGGVLRAMVPGQECPPSLQNVEATRCDACHVKRIRNDVFILRHEDGREVVVGRTCLKDYLGHVSPEAIAYLASILTQLDRVGDSESEFWGGYVPSMWTVQEVFTTASYCIRTYGWSSSKEERSTKEDVWDLLLPHNDPHQEAKRRETIASFRASDTKKADATLAWLEEIEASSDYLYNLKAIAESDSVTAKTMGLAVSAVFAYDRAREREIERKRKQSQDKKSEYVGEVKKRTVFDLTVDRVRTWENAYGTVTLVAFRDKDGNVLVWKASRNPHLDAGDSVKVKGTVKEHSLYNDVKQTVLTRCKVEETESQHS